MDIADEDIAIFKELYKKEYDLVLTTERAIDELTKLRQLYELIYITAAPRSRPASTTGTGNAGWYTEPATHKIIN